MHLFYCGIRIRNNYFNFKRYDEAKITAKINHEIRQHMRYAELKEIMYYVQKKEIIKESGDE